MEALKAAAHLWTSRKGRASKSADDRNGAPAEPRSQSVGSAPEQAVLIDRLITALDLDPLCIPDQINRDLRHTCVMCKEKSRCGFDLATGCCNTTYQAYCPSAHTLGTLRALQWSFQRLSIKCYS
jgi:hypothetical protein